MTLKIAVVGAGPAGRTSAMFLAKMALMLIYLKKIELEELV